MSKQTKQLIFLIVLIVVGGGAALYFNLRSDGTAAPAPAPAAAATTNPPPAAPPNPGAPPQPGQPAAPAVVDLTKEPMPLPENYEAVSVLVAWPVEAGAATTIAYDPLHVQNLDVVAPARRQAIDKIRQEWVVEGVTITMQMVRIDTKVLDEDGNPVKDEEGQDAVTTHYEKQPVAEVWFRGKRRPYRTDDRLTNTRFVIRKIITSHMETAVELQGDNGEELKLVLAQPGRYAD